jgi:pimeloyl-ACP methyl ester carboxylesterase
MKRLSWLFFGLALFAMLYTPADGQEKKGDPKAPLKAPAPSFKHLDGQNLVFVANGVGGSTVVSDNLMELNEAMHLHLRICAVPWTRHNALFQDLDDHVAQLGAAQRLAGHVAAIRKDAPNAHIFFVGHSAGTRVVLAAAEMLPEKSVDRIILLASAVSYSYDLTGALKASRYGIDHFYSTEDGILDSAVEHKGTADGLKVQAAGRIGFRPCSTDKKDLEAYRSVRQYRWTAEWHGNGGHFTWTLQHNMKKTVVPMFFTPPPEPAPIVVKKK